MQKLLEVEDLQYMRLHTDCDNVFFISSAGHCTFNCVYCIVNPIVKKQPSLTYADIEFLLAQFRGKSFLIFSGQGDFFASYSKSQRLLEQILNLEVEIALDINGAVIQEFTQLSDEKLAKIRYINLTMHYNEIKNNAIEQLWVRNAIAIIDRKNADMLLGYIMSGKLASEWAEALEFYAQQIFAVTGKKIILVRDVLQPFTPEQEQLFGQLCQEYAYLLAGTHNNDFAKIFAKSQVLCPAGKNYFRIWNDGRVQGCPYLPVLQSAGNLKQRTIKINPESFACDSPEFCDCHVIAGLGKMLYRDSTTVDQNANQCFI